MSIQSTISQIKYLINKLSIFCQEDTDYKFIKHKLDCLINDLVQQIDRVSQDDSTSQAQRQNKKLQIKILELKSKNQELAFQLRREVRLKEQAQVPTDEPKAKEIDNIRIEKIRRGYQKQIDKRDSQIRALYRELRRKYQDLPSTHAEYFLSEKEKALKQYFNSTPVPQTEAVPKKSMLFDW